MFTEDLIRSILPIHDRSPRVPIYGPRDEFVESV
jgi:hypothetical protein